MSLSVNKQMNITITSSGAGFNADSTRELGQELIDAANDGFAITSFERKMTTDYRNETYPAGWEIKLRRMR